MAGGLALARMDEDHQRAAKKIQSGLLGVNRTLAELANNAAGGRGNLRVFQQASAAWVRGDSDRSFHGPEMQDPGPV